MEASQSRVIVVSTHSHLMLDRETLLATQVMHNGPGEGVRVGSLKSPQELMDVVFRLLGNSTEDLFFPKNYVVVEGASDQVIVERAVELVGHRSPKIKILSAGGVDGVQATLDAVRRALVPLIVNDSPYAKTVVALIDKAPAQASETLARLKSDLGERLIELPADSIEEYLPEALYARAGRDKRTDLQTIGELRSQRVELQAFKKEVSNALAAAMTLEDVHQADLIHKAAVAALADRLPATSQVPP